MSGGVDSSLAAALLVEEGHEVWGISLRVFDPGRCQEGEDGTCCSARDIRDARAVAARLGIPFSSWDVRREFEDEVIEPFAREYLRGRTPNPCVTCNSRIKFGLLLRKAREMGADGVATGHYARIARTEGGYELRRGVDRGKDQSYFLFEVNEEALPFISFPLGGMTKAEVRLRAGALGLETAAKRESQEICFVPDGDYGAFLRDRPGGGGGSPGPIVDGAGRRVGTHGGLHRYTVGQRRGLGVAAGKPLYVVRLDAGSNTLVVGEDGDLRRRSLRVAGLNWFGGRGADALRADVRIRHRHRESPALLSRGDDESWLVRFDVPQRAVTPGQAAVFYDGDRVVGGGWIDALP